MLQRLMIFKNLDGWWSEGFCSINYSEYSKSIREKLYSKLSEEQNIWKFAELLYIFLSTPNEVEKYVEIMQSSLSDKYVHRYNIEILNLFDSEL